ncbi:MAG: hypothetical protein ACREYC_20900 [Gammaproteobacteria bacterium]
MLKDFVNVLWKQPASFWISILAFCVSACSLLLSNRSSRFARRLTATEKRTQALALLTEAKLKSLQLNQDVQDLKVRSSVVRALNRDAAPGNDVFVQLKERMPVLLQGVQDHYDQVENYTSGADPLIMEESITKAKAALIRLNDILSDVSSRRERLEKVIIESERKTR